MGRLFRLNKLIPGDWKHYRVQNRTRYRLVVVRHHHFIVIEEADDKRSWRVLSTDYQSAPVQLLPGEFGSANAAVVALLLSGEVERIRRGENTTR